MLKDNRQRRKKRSLGFIGLHGQCRCSVGSLTWRVNGLATEFGRDKG